MPRLFTRFLAALGEKKAIRRDCAQRITAAFEGVDWTKHNFCVDGGEFITTADGERFFYKVSEIDPAIKRLNKVLTDLQT